MASRHLVTEGVILKVKPSGESNRIFSFISPELGVAYATAYGAAKIKSRFCASVQPLTKMKLFLYKSPKADIYRLDDIAEVEPFDELRAGLNPLYLFSFYVDVLLRSFISHEEARSYFYLLKYSLELLREQAGNVGIMNSFLFFTVKYLFLGGYRFSLSGCRSCGKSRGDFYFEPQRGGIFCPAHTKSRTFKLEESDMLVFRLFFEESYKVLRAQEMPEYNFTAIYSIINGFFDHIFEGKIKSFGQLKGIFS